MVFARPENHRMSITQTARLFVPETDIPGGTGDISNGLGLSIWAVTSGTGICDKHGSAVSCRFPSRFLIPP